MKRSRYLLIAAMLLSNCLFADHNQHLFEQGNTLYAQDKYEEAIETYKEIRANGCESWELYYNLGNAYYKNGDLGKAILNYERARLLESDNEDIQFNLEMANLMVADKINQPPQFFLFKIFSDFKNSMGLNILSLIVLATYVLLTAFAISYILVKRRKIRQLSFVVSIPVALLFVVFTTVFVLRIQDLNNLKYGIIIDNKVDVVSSPEGKGTEIFSLHEGVKVQAEKQVGEWLQIRLSDGKVGWLKKSAIEII